MQFIANGLLVPEAGRMRSVSNKDAIRLWLMHMVVVSWAGFSNQTTMHRRRKDNVGGGARFSHKASKLLAFLAGWPMSIRARRTQKPIRSMRSAGLSGAPAPPFPTPML